MKITPYFGLLKKQDVSKTGIFLTHVVDEYNIKKEGESTLFFMIVWRFPLSYFECLRLLSVIYLDDVGIGGEEW